MFSLLLPQNHDQNIHELSVPLPHLDEHAYCKLFNASIYKVLGYFQEPCFPNDRNDISSVFMSLTIIDCCGNMERVYDRES